MLQLTLDAPERATAASGGFRLERLEVYNWGTFNGRIWTLEPHGGAALLTGANGSGKSTLVDALLTLLVPPTKRSYNQASGSEKRRERDEKSYVRGAYSKIRDDESNTGVTQFLRGKDDYTALLAVFADARTERAVTLAQVFWTQDGDLKKFFVVADRALTIERHLAVAKDMATLRRRLRDELGAETFDEFSKYSVRFRKLLNLRSEKALDLFNQTVSIKEIVGLNAFVRAHMLEKTDFQEKIGQLRANFENLTRAHDAIQKAERQLAALQPLVANLDRHRQVSARIVEAEQCAAAAPLYFARQKLALLDTALAAAARQLQDYARAREAVSQRFEALRRQELDLEVAINNDTAGQRIQQVEQEIGHVRERRASRRREAERYDQLARQLALPPYADEATFAETRRRAEEALAEQDERLRAIEAQRDERKRELNALDEQRQAQQSELESLRQRASQIPASDLRIRAQLAAALDIPEAAMPFIGELLAVRADSRRWEPAIERLLHDVGRQALVPEALYQQVSGYVDATDLRGKLVYHRVVERAGAEAMGVDGSGASEPEMLVSKLAIKPDTPFRAWLERELTTRQDYRCCETLEQFRRARRAITLNGQIKSGDSRHIKDDRSPLGDRKRYVLGWDNREKIAALEGELATLARALASVTQALDELARERARGEDRQRQVRDLLRYDEFARLHWREDDARLRELEAHLRELEASAGQLHLLRGRLELVRAQSAETQAEGQRLDEQSGAVKGELAGYTRQRGECAALLGAATPEALAALERVRAELEQAADAPRLDAIDTLQAQTERRFLSSAIALRGTLTTLTTAIDLAMNDFKRDFPDETQDIAVGVESGDEFAQLLARIQQDDLPRHASRFKELLNEKVITDIAHFKAALERQVADIRGSIERLNQSLATIEYTPTTYIQLLYTTTRDPAIREFQRDLRACLPDVGLARAPETNEASFQRIKALIERFESDHTWMTKVADVRNWLEFAAEERYTEGGQQKHYYSDSSGKSGGQKAKLAYTILASAIAYQYGLDQPESSARAFRFVVVDEAFSKSDETNARYAMELFKRLNLQLLVVTPLDKTHVVEPYIAACHLVTNSEEENDSMVYTLTIQQYRERKGAFDARRANVADVAGMASR